ncbi:MAG: 30S ribosomal protein S7 [Candidatus Melainabacteria bacterium RIFOXYA12_FULL_32_12]|nr:MAG: 30S ribosomal protein S7 [Candidatus Melainabacteria bacterium GWF2_32_7]OGI21073.1 MAG: 30S ribosomal protein S7 [Candidatus Melainabacteria bacterium RIFOXYA2_FULL_32_9]OGI26567.1 MAG: 30S ribosomal protein S7 [Candidatus Melainabacteria bacterium RIFOXYA12_FULL_32_12]
MSRRNKPPKRVPLADPLYNSVDIAKFINRLMRRGKKSVAERIFYTALDRIKERTQEEPLEIFNKALKNVTPLIEVKARRIGGSTYQVPIEVRTDRGIALGSTWLINAAKTRGGKSMTEKLIAEISDAANGVGSAVKKREDTHKMAEANKAFAHYRY